MELVKKLRVQIVELQVENKYLKRYIDQLTAKIKILNNNTSYRSFKNMRTKKVLSK